MILQRYTFGSKSQPIVVCMCSIQVAYDIAKIYIWKQITTVESGKNTVFLLLMILQRYTFGSKSQPYWRSRWRQVVAYDIAKIYIWKQITTVRMAQRLMLALLMILQRYTFGSKSQPEPALLEFTACCLWYCKDIHLEANHNFQTRELSHI